MWFFFSIGMDVFFRNCVANCFIHDSLSPWDCSSTTARKSLIRTTILDQDHNKKLYENVVMGFRNAPLEDKQAKRHSHT